MRWILAAMWLLLPAPLFAQAIRDRDAAGAAAQFNAPQGWGQTPDTRWQAPGSGWRPPSYTLGVNVRNTDRGVVVTNVLQGSAAQRAGIERNDVIIAVGGYQVGYVGRQLYDLGDEINARVGADGRVILLIQDTRTKELRNLQVDMQSARQVVRGTARWGTDVPLSRDAMLVVRIIDVTNPTWRDTIVVEEIIRGVSRGSAEYQIAYSPNALQPNHRYAISAHLRDGNTVPFELTTPRNINLAAANQRIDFTLDRARNPGGSGPIRFPTAEIVDLYQSLLGRPPTGREITLWQAEFARGATLQDVRRQILSGSEYYERYNNNDDRYLRELYGATTGRTPDAAELERLKQQLRNTGGLRTELVRELLNRINPDSPR